MEQERDGRRGGAAELAAFLRDAVFLDLETTRDARLRLVGAVRDGREFSGRAGRDPRSLLRDLDDFAAGASAVLGHNILGHDLPVLRALAPGLGLLRLPVVDTLFLSPLAFPENPYHRLVKDYKLLGATANDPVADAKLAALVFADQWEALRRLAVDAPDLLALFAFAFRGVPLGAGGSGDGLARVFDAAGAGPALTAAQAEAVFARIAGDRACAAAVPRVAALARDPARRPELAYAAAFLRVAGGKSVQPPWLRRGFPRMSGIIRELRDASCGEPECAYCREAHDPESQLRHFFGFPGFRTTGGHAVQREIVLAGMRDEPLLAILPTGGGKSLGFQLPAFVRHRKRGALTIVISPLQALMKDQVDGLVRRTESDAAAALCGLLSPPERREVMERVRLGDVALLYVSPEQLRNPSFGKTIRDREVGAVVFDEAHCISKWGHDFRPDYFHATRFFREFAKEHGVVVPPVSCFTATATAEVTAEIRDHFRRELSQDLRVIEGPLERDNLGYAVEEVTQPGKLPRLRDIIAQRLAGPDPGAGIVYVATRAAAESTAEYLVREGLPAAAFHAGLPAPEKRRIQEDFLGDRLPVICATNAFGMGVDKPDVRLVIHADVPGSLECYVQEAGRAGRDQHRAECVLLFAPEDVETQFSLAARSRLSRRDIAGILKALRAATRRRGVELVLTSGDILRDEEAETDIDSADRGADTKVKTALSWLERARFLSRDENRTQVFEGVPKERDLARAGEKLAARGVDGAARDRLLAVLDALIRAEPGEGVTMDELAGLSGYAGSAGENGGALSLGVVRDLNDLVGAGLLEKGLALTAFVRPRGANTSKMVFARACEAERALLALLREEAPDADQGGWQHLSLRVVNQRLTDRGVASSPEMVRLLLKSLSLDGHGLAGSRGSLELAFAGRGHYRVKVLRSWDALETTVRIRERVAEETLGLLLERVREKGAGEGEMLVAFHLEEVASRLAECLDLAGELRKPVEAIERGLMFLNEQRAIIVQQGLAVFRAAMTIRLDPAGKGRKYGAGEYGEIARHYEQRVFKVHAMKEYARLGISKLGHAIRFARDYFALAPGEFARRYFRGREAEVARATAPESFQRIVDDLGNPEQAAVVTATADENLLVLAGPGSGKTRVVVHRCAYLLRVLRARPESILVLAFNHHAAVDLRRRLAALVGRDARGVTVTTYHGLSMRITGSSFAGRGEAEPDFDAEVKRAARILRGEEDVPGLPPDEVRDRLLSGYRHILVDEYQDIDADQYDLVSALAGRTRDDPDEKLAILAVGDDDQNIYAFRGTNVEFLRRFTEDYGARSLSLLDNYRSTGHIVAAANAFIERNRDRMKTGQPIRVNAARAEEPAGGRFTTLDPVVQGRVQVIRAPSPGAEVAAIVAEVARLVSLGARPEDCAVLARTHEALAPLRALFAHERIPVSVPFEPKKAPPLFRIREVAECLDDLRGRREASAKASALLAPWAARAAAAPGNAWLSLLDSLLDAWRAESDDAEAPPSLAAEFVGEALALRRRDSRHGRGVFLGTVHGAKGLEFGHVLIAGAGWGKPGKPGDAEDERRLFYVAMTRARETLALFATEGVVHPHLSAFAGLGEAVLERAAPLRPDPPAGVLSRRTALLGMSDLFIDYAGSKGARDPIHARIAALSPGAPLALVERGEQLVLESGPGREVARLSASARKEWRPRLASVLDVRVVAVIRRRRDDTGEEHRERMARDDWEIPLAEVTFDGGR